MKLLSNNKIKATLLAGAVACATITSCQKGFDPKSYAPSKPLPTFGGYSASKDIEPASLVAYYPFTTSLADSIAGGTGVATGTSFAKGLNGNGLKGAANAYALYDTPAAIKALKSFTASIWVNMPQNNAAIGLMDIQNDQPGGAGFWGSLAIFFDNGGSATKGVLKVHAFNIAGSSAGVDGWEGGYSVDDPWNKWINVTVTFDAASSTIYVYYNGALAGKNTVAGFAPMDWSKAAKMVFGTLQFQTTPSLTANTGAQGWAGYVTGTLDNIRFYNKALSASQVSALYNLEAAGR
ncbi:concanavalin A-like lectin/glucanase superfamily protein [Mucilaginibacter oryzae]|uniref:Concanavalin A-like lectin/glucanase superfamily protein n=1 Tax=Mucilaginibacter oryzae TaxID=468058 RepID=A0A316HHZ3_9SPHI|nr:LamG domain-containing protein [Mucilaginibacter oryzae]PWK77885.1 concanavalin A-like lectin/glucanase superfamily protein [Mucilaginibacter oryzae]